MDKGGEGGDGIRRSRSSRSSRSGGRRRRRLTPLSDAEIEMINGHWVDTDITSNMHRLIEMNDVPTMIRVLEEVSEFFRGGTRRGWMLSSKKVSHLFVCFVLFCLFV